MIDRFSRLRAALGRACRRPNGLLRNCSGTTAILFAFAAIPLMAVVGTTIDYGNAFGARSSLQSAVDAAALAAAVTQDTATPDPATKARSVFDAQTLNLPFASAVNFNAGKVDDTATVTVDAQVSTSFLQLLGISSIAIEVSAQARSPGFDGEVVLVLDYSSSMGGTKYQNMRDGAIELINVITTQQTNTDVKIALVPFAREVYASLPGEHVLGGTPGTTWTNCTGDRKWPYNTDDSTPTADIATKWGRTDSDDTIDPDEYDGCTSYPTNNLVVRPLTDDHSGTVAQLQAMTPHSGTNTAVGLQMGWQVVSPNVPFTEATNYGSEKQKVIILLSDGRQNKPGWGAGGNHTDDNAIANTDTLCAGIKNKNIIMVTVAYEIDDPDGKAQLAACATSGKYYVEGDEGSILEVFQGLGHTILAKNLHLVN